MEGDGTEAEGTEEDGEALGFVHGAGEDDGRVAGEGVAGEKVHEVEVFVFVREEEVVLQEGVYGLVFVRGDADAERVLQAGALQGFYFAGHGGGE